MAWIVYLLMVLIILIILAPLAIWDREPMAMRSILIERLLPAFGNSLFYGFFIGLISTVLASLLAYPLLLPRDKFRWLRRLYCTLLALCFAIAFNPIGDLTFGETLKMASTRGYIITMSIMPIIPAFALAWCVSGKFCGRVPSYFDFLKAALWPMLVIFLTQFSLMTGAFFIQLEQPTSIAGLGTLAYNLCYYELLFLGCIEIDPGITKNAVRFVMLLASIVPVLAGTAALVIDRLKNKVSAFGARLGR